MRLTRLVIAAMSGALVGSACVVELEHAIACGDGFRDAAAGEECDPEDERSYVEACNGVSGSLARPGCDSTSCKLTCSWCGDGNVDDGEECDSGHQATGLLAFARACTGSGLGTDHEVAPLDSPYGDTPYTSGQSTRCLADCTYDRSNCGYCGNGRREVGDWIVSLPSQTTVSYRAEWCDGDDIDYDKLAEFHNCGSDAVANAECSKDCRNFDLRDGPPCCVRSGDPCPADDDEQRCCHEFSAPDAEQHCSDSFANPGETGDSGGSEGGRTCL